MECSKRGAEKGGANSPFFQNVNFPFTQLHFEIHNKTPAATNENEMLCVTGSSVVEAGVWWAVLAQFSSGFNLPSTCPLPSLAVENALLCLAVQKPPSARIFTSYCVSLWFTAVTHRIQFWVTTTIDPIYVRPHDNGSLSELIVLQVSYNVCVLHCWCIYLLDDGIKMLSATTRLIRFPN